MRLLLWTVQCKTWRHGACSEALAEVAALAGGVASDVMVGDHCNDLRGVASLARGMADAHAADLKGMASQATTRLAKAKYGDFMLVSKRATSAVFRKQGRLLSLIKALKKL